MENRLYEFWVACLQDGYIGNLIEICEKAGGAKNLYYMDAMSLREQLQLTDRMIKHIMDNRFSEDEIKRRYDEMIENNINYVNYSDLEYPLRLNGISSRPYGLFVRGRLPDEHRRAVAIIGARECSEYGRLMAEYFADRLARYEVDIISGMAWGIDGIAQMAAIQAGGRSYGILGCGVDIIYPNKNRKLYERLMENGSGLISEYAPATPAAAKHFPPRNRIISGMSDLVIVVEAKARSGTLITVDMAMEQDRTVMVVPGRVTDALSVGCLNLMYEGAFPAVSIDSVLYQLGMDNNTGDAITIAKDEKTEGKAQRRIINPGSNIIHGVREKQCVPVIGRRKKLPGGDKGKVLSFLGLEPMSIDEIARKAGMPVTALMVIMTELEMEEYVKEVSQMNFVAVF